MANDSLKDLNDLEAAFRQWRRTKRHLTERVPPALAEQVARVAARHGVAAVTRVTGSAGRRIALPSARPKPRPPLGSSSPKAVRPSPASVPVPAPAPAYSRIQLPAPQSPVRVAPAVPALEVETPRGFKLRVFSTEPGALALVREMVGTHGKEPGHDPDSR